MITYQQIELETDHPTLCAWWDGHKAQQVPAVILPRGWFAVAGGIKVAASFLYVADGKIAVIEWTTTNPQCAYSRDLVEAVRGLYGHLEGVARSEGCLSVISFVKPKSSEERIMTRIGYATSVEDPGHKLYAKALQNEAAWAEASKGGIV